MSEFERRKRAWDRTGEEIERLKAERDALAHEVDQLKDYIGILERQLADYRGSDPIPF